LGDKPKEINNIAKNRTPQKITKLQVVGYWAIINYCFGYENFTAVQRSTAAHLIFLGVVVVLLVLFSCWDLLLAEYRSL